jgi:tRNA threonylcarbamoyladenosine biosynthesis protein TsaE
MINITLKTLHDTQALAQQLAAQCHTTDCLALYGNVGAGKTTFARYFLEALGWTSDVPSPTFTIAQFYELPHHNTVGHTVWHLDAYRLKSAAEAVETGLEDCFQNSICLVEWPQNIAGLLPKNRLALHFSLEGNTRSVEYTGHGHWQHNDIFPHAS